MRFRAGVGLVVVALLAGCGDASPPGFDAPGFDAPGFTVTELVSPAGSDSGEPFLSATDAGLLMSWLERSAEGGHELRFASFGAGAFGEVRTIVHSDRFFVNWADFPSVTLTERGDLWAHWLERGEGRGYDYGVRIASSNDGGATWTEPFTPHETRTRTEHGFVSAMPTANGMGFIWLDGRNYADGTDGSLATEEMGLRYREIGVDGTPGPELVVDARVCDCCQTDAAVAGSGPVAVYRDRTEGEIRDIYITRLVDGAWTPGVPVHDDGWEIGGCPVNGPAVAVLGDEVVVAWFTAAGDTARVRLARSTDGGVTFGEPVRIDDGDPSGRVDLVLTEDGTAVVSWLERTAQGAADVRLRRVARDGRMAPSAPVAGSSEERGSGFPRLAWAPDGRLIVAWTDEGARRVLVAAMEFGGG